MFNVVCGMVGYGGQASPLDSSQETQTYLGGLVEWGCQKAKACGQWTAEHHIDKIVPNVLSNKEDKVKEDLEKLRKMYESDAVFLVVNQLIQNSLSTFIQKKKVNETSQQTIAQNIQHIILSALISLSQNVYDKKRMIDPEATLTLNDLIENFKVVVESCYLDTPSPVIEEKFESQTPGLIINECAVDMITSLFNGGALEEGEIDILIDEVPKRVRDTLLYYSNLVKTGQKKTLESLSSEFPKVKLTRQEEKVARELQNLYGNDVPVRLINAIIDRYGVHLCKKAKVPREKMEQLRDQMRLKMLNNMADKSRQALSQLQAKDPTIQFLHLDDLGKVISPREQMLKLVSLRLFTRATGKNFDKTRLLSSEEAAKIYQIRGRAWEFLDGKVKNGIGLEEIRDEMLPQMLSNLFHPTKMLEVKVQELKAAYPENGGEKAAAVLAKMIATDVLPSLLIDHKDDDGRKIAKAILDAVGFQSKDRENVEQGLANQLMEVVKEDRKGNLKEIVENLLKDYFSVMFANLGNVAVKVDQSEDKKMKQLAKGVISDACLFFKAFEKVKESHVSKEKEHEALLNEFAQMGMLNSEWFLHGISADDATLSTEEKEKFRLENFHKPFAKRLLKVMFPEGMQSLQLPNEISENVREKIWKRLEDEILPKVLHSLLQQLKDPNLVRQQIVKLYANLNSQDQTVPSSGSVQKVFGPKDLNDTKIQEEINEEMTGLISSSMDVFFKGIVKNMVKDSISSYGKKAGEMIGDQLDAWPLAKILDQGLLAMEQTLAPDGVYKNRFFISEEEKKANELNSIEKTNQLEEEMVQGRQKALDGIFKGAKEALKKNVGEAVDNLIDHNSEEDPKLKKMKESIAKAIKFLLIDLIGNFFYFVLAPIWFPVYLGVDHYGKKKLKEMEEVMTHQMNEWMIMRSMERFLKTLESASAEI